MEGTCPRCGGATGQSRWCPTCGKKLRGGLTLPTPEAAEAARRETAWLEEQRAAAAHPGWGEPPATAPAAGGVPPYGAGPVSPYGAGPASPYGAGLVSPYAAGPASPYAPAPAPPYGPAPAPPYGPGDVPAPAGPAGLPPPVDPSGLAQMVRVFLYANIVAASIVGILDAVFLREVNDLIGGGGLPETRDEAGIAAVVAYMGQVLLMCVTAGFFIAWLHRVYKNARGLGATELRYGEGWAIGGWFVPIMNYWRPKEIVNDAWRASDPGLGVYADRREWEGAPVPGVFLAWWLVYLLSGVLGSITNRLWAGTTEPEEERVAALAAIGTEMVLILAALLALRVVALITVRQRERAAEREHMAVPAAPAPV